MKDTIYREDAIKALERRYEDILRIFKRKVKVGEKALALDLIECVKALPSADRPQGEWISKHNGYWTCSECGLSFLFYAKGNYCPNCGAKMKGADDEV